MKLVAQASNDIHVDDKKEFRFQYLMMMVVAMGVEGVTSCTHAHNKNSI